MNNEIFKVNELRELKGLLVVWSLGNYCTYKCSYCSPWYNNGAYAYHPLENIRNILKLIPDHSKIIFSGGEPTYHPDFETILDEKPSTFIYGIISNGARPYSFWERAVTKLDNITLTFHSEFANLDRFVETALLCKDKIRQINLTMIPWLWEESVNAYNTFTEKNLPVSAKPLVKDFGFRASSLIDDYLPEQIEWIKEKNKKPGLKYIGLYNSTGDLIKNTNPSEMLIEENTDFLGWECYTPTKVLYINPNGDMFNTACKQRKKVGTIYTGFEVENTPISCEQNFCWCHSDIAPLKIKS